MTRTKVDEIRDLLMRVEAAYGPLRRDLRFSATDHYVTYGEEGEGMVLTWPDADEATQDILASVLRRDMVACGLDVDIAAWPSERERTGYLVTATTALHEPGTAPGQGSGVDILTAHLCCWLAAHDVGLVGGKGRAH